VSLVRSARKPHQTPRVPPADSEATKLKHSRSSSQPRLAPVHRRVKVAVRCRPPLTDELLRDERERESQRQAVLAATQMPAFGSKLRRSRVGDDGDSDGLESPWSSVSERGDSRPRGGDPSRSVSKGKLRMGRFRPTGVAVRIPKVEEGGMETLIVREHDESSASLDESRWTRGQEWRFDAVFGPESSQDDVYDRMVGPVVAQVLAGYCGAVMAYGQTGTGKSHTMGILSRVKSEGAGVIPRALSHVFGHIGRGGGGWSVGMQFLQIYLENVYDLLPASGSVGSDMRSLSVREAPDRGFYAPDAVEWEVSSFDEAVAAVNQGLESRVLGCTKMNATSSRSHTLLTVTVKHASTRASGGVERSVGRLSLVDLAGSERVARTASTGARLEEARSINSSLAALGNVVAKLAELSREGGGDASSHVPFRDSKLTRLLSRSLGGTAETCVIATIGPMAVDRSETLSTLKFAERCMQVQSRPVRSVIIEDPTTRALDSSRVSEQPSQQQSDNTLAVAQAAARAAVAEAESRWQEREERLRAEYEVRMSRVVESSHRGLARRVQELSAGILEALRVPRPPPTGKGAEADAVELLESATRAIQPLLSAPSGGATPASHTPPELAGSGREEELANQALLLRYLLEANAKLRHTKGQPTPFRPSAASVASSSSSAFHVGLRTVEAAGEEAKSTHTGVGMEASSLEEDDEAAEPERIVSKRVGAGGVVEYRVRWRGEGEAADEWFAAVDLQSDFPDLVKRYETK
jgi:hypothetical protein